jgi:hypothetical protein
LITITWGATSFFSIVMSGIILSRYTYSRLYNSKYS